MELIIKKGNLFELDSKEYSFAHCISSDCEMGAGIAVEFQKRFSLRGNLIAKYDTGRKKHPTCIFEKGVFNLITKEKYWHKPTYESLKGALEEMRRLAINNNIKKIAMPKIGSGLDRLQWAKVQQIIDEIFNDLDVEIQVRYL